MDRKSDDDRCGYRCDENVLLVVLVCEAVVLVLMVMLMFFFRLIYLCKMLPILASNLFGMVAE